MTESLNFNITANDSASSKFTKVGDSTGIAAKGVAGLQKGLSGLTRVIGGEVGEMLTRVNEGLGELGEHGMKVGQGLMVAGGAIGAVGLMLDQMGSKEKAASQQLQQAILNTGGSWEDYKEEVEKAIGSQEKYGHSALDTQGALQTLTQATNDPTKALEDMNLVSDLAAAKHESLGAAAQQLAMVYGGSGKVLKQFGIQMQTNADGTKDVEGAIDQLTSKLNGQADAASDTFSGHLKEWRTRAEDFVASWAGKVGPVLTMAGPLLFGVGAILESQIIGKTAGAIKGWLGLATATETATEASALEAAAAVESAEAETAAAAATEAHGAAAEVSAGQLSLMTDAELANTAATAENAEAQAADAAASEAASGSKLASVAKGGLVVAAVAATSYALVKGAQAFDEWINKDNAAHKAFGSITEDMQSFKKALEEDNGVLGQHAQEAAAAAIQNSLLGDKAAKSGISLAQLTAGVTGTDEEYKKLIDTWKSSGKPSNDTIGALELLRHEVVQTSDDTSKLTEESKKNGLASADMAAGATTAAAAIVKEKDATSALTDTIQALNDERTGEANANIGFMNSIDSLNKAIEDNGATMDMSTRKGRDNQSAVIASIQAGEANAEAIFKQTGSNDQFAASLEDSKRQILDTAGNNRELRDTIQGLIDKYDVVPTEINTALKINAQTAINQLTDVVALIHDAEGTHYAGITISSADRTNSGDAVGGGLTPGVTPVGEYGKELVSWDGPGSTPQVISNSQMRSGGSGGGTVYMVSVSVQGSVVSENDLITSIQDGIAQRQSVHAGPNGVNIYGG